MNRNDYNLIAAVLREEIDRFDARPALAMRMAEAFARRGDRLPDFHLEDFLNRCVPPKLKVEAGPINPGRTAPQQKERTAVQTEADASLFSAILATEFPHLVGVVGCSLSPRQSSRFGIGRIGGKVWIRFGEEAIADPVAAVRAAAPDAEAMARGQTSAREIIGR